MTMMSFGRVISVYLEEVIIIGLGDGAPGWGGIDYDGFGCWCILITWIFILW